MATLCALQLVRLTGVHDNHASSSSVPVRRSKAGLKNELLHVSGLRIAPHHRVGSSLGRQTGCSSLWDHLRVSSRINHHVQSGRLPVLASSALPSEEQIKKVASMFIDYGAQLIRRTASVVQLCPPLVAQTAPAFGLMVFTIWGLGPTMRFFHKIIRKTDRNWDGSRTRHIMASYMRPILLWIGVIVICRAFDPVVLSTNASQAIKQRFVNFVRSLSTVLAFAFCTASLTQQVQKFMMEHQDTEDARNVGVQFIGNAVYTSVWVAAVCLFMELLGFSTQKWITAGGFGTVLLTLAGREIFTNFLSSIMIHATRPFVDNEWIQTKIEGQEVSGTVEHVGWWSPTVIRGDDREAVHIPNHKFSVSVVRNLSQKTHWRIKTHFGISHLDVNKLPDIIRDMRRVLSKNPQVEQQRLHRRAFFDTIDPENQALQILISCFVKTSHFEEYLRVKEMILLDLLKVISNHNARLATPIRSVQRVLDESESRGAPFRDVRANAEARRRPFLLMAQAMSDDESEDDKDDVPDEVSRLGADLAKATNVVTSGNIDENGVTMEDLTDLKDPSVISKPKESTSVSGGIGITVASSTISASHISLTSAKSDTTLQEDSHPTDLDAEDKQAGIDDATLELTVATSQTVANEIVIEEPVEAIPYLYSNNVGLDEESHRSGGKTLADSADDPWRQSSSSHVPASETQPRPPSIAVKLAGDSSTQTDIHVLQKQSGHLKDITSQHTVVPASHPSGADPPLIAKNVVQAGVSTLPTDNDDPWKQPPASHVQNTERSQPKSSFVDGSMHTDNTISMEEQGVTEKGNLENTVAARHAIADHVTGKHVGAGLSLYSDNVLDDKSDEVAAHTSPASSDDPWKQPPALHVQDTERPQPRSPFVDGSMHTDNVSVEEQGVTGKGTLKHAVAARHAIADHVTDKHVGAGLSLYSDNVLDDKSDEVSAHTSPASSDDPWKQPPALHVQDTERPQPRSSFVDGSMHTDTISVEEQGVTGKGTLEHTVAARHAIADHVTDKHVGAGLSLYSDNVLDDKSDEVAASTSSASSDDPWKQPSVSHAQGSKKSVLQARPPVIENNLVVPGVAIEGPKHTLPLDDDSIPLGDSRTLVALGKAKNISKEHTKGGVSSDTTDRER